MVTRGYTLPIQVALETGPWSLFFGIQLYLPRRYTDQPFTMRQKSKTPCSTHLTRLYYITVQTLAYLQLRKLPQCPTLQKNS